MGKSKATVLLLVNIGAIVSIVLAALACIPYWGWGWGWSFGSYWFTLIWSIVIIVIFALGLLFGTGLLKIWFIKMKIEFLWLLIIGLLILIPTANWGGVLVIIAAILDKVG